MLSTEQIQNISRQLTQMELHPELSESNPQLLRLIAKHFSRFVGVDVCQLSFDAVAKNADSQVVKRGQFDNDHDGFSAFSLWLNELSTNESYRIIVAIECTGPYHLALVRFLKESGIEVFLFNGQTAKNLARAHLKEKKTDTLDAEILANLLIDGKFPTSAAQSDNEFIAIRSLSRRSSRYTQQIACAKTRLKDELCQSSLGMLKVFPNQAVFSKAATELMKLYPLPTDRLAAGVEEVTRVLSTISRNHYGKKEAEKLLAFDAQNQPDERLCDYFRQSITDYISDIQYFETKRGEYATQIQSMTKELKPANN